MTMSWKAGVAKVDFTPPIGCSLTGYLMRAKKCDRVEHQLVVKALAITEGTEKVVCNELSEIEFLMVLSNVLLAHYFFGCLWDQPIAVTTTL